MIKSSGLTEDTEIKEWSLTSNEKHNIKQKTETECCDKIMHRRLSGSPENHFLHGFREWWKSRLLKRGDSWPEFSAIHMS